jgi:hypothetical protein
MTYRCVFPNCTYETEDRSLIEFHHIHPKELGVKLNKDVTIPLCPTHHKMIYHPGATAGQHSENRPGSLEVVQVATTTAGKAVVFRDVAGNDITVTVDVTRPKPDAIYELKWDLINGISERGDRIDIPYSQYFFIITEIRLIGFTTTQYYSQQSNQ